MSIVDLFIFCLSSLNPQHIEQCLVHSKCSINLCSMKEGKGSGEGKKRGKKEGKDRQGNKKPEKTSFD